MQCNAIASRRVLPNVGQNLYAPYINTNGPTGAILYYAGGTGGYTGTNKFTYDHNALTLDVSGSTIKGVSGQINFSGTSISLLGPNVSSLGPTANSIVLDNGVDTLGHFYVNPIRNGPTGPNMLYYNTDSKEITYGVAPTGGGGGSITSLSAGNGITLTPNNPITSTGSISITNGSGPTGNILFYTGGIDGFTGISNFNYNTTTKIISVQGNSIQGVSGQIGFSTTNIAIGLNAGNTSQGANSIAIGQEAGYTGQPDNTIILNATGSQLNGITGQTGAFYAKPIRTTVNALDNSFNSGIKNLLLYNNSTAEITQNSKLSYDTSNNVLNLGGNNNIVGVDSKISFSGLNQSIILGFNAASVDISTNITGNIKIGNLDYIGSPNFLVGQSDDTLAIGTGAGNYNQGADAVAIGTGAGNTNQGPNAIAIGNIAGQNGQLSNAIAIGFNAGQNNQQVFAVAIGNEAGFTGQLGAAIAIGQNAGQTNQHDHSVAIGPGAGTDNQGQYAIAIGYNAGFTGQLENNVAIGQGAGSTNQGGSAVAIGQNAGQNNQNNFAVAIGSGAGVSGQGPHAVAIGFRAGNTGQAANTIVLNATGSFLNGIPSQPSSFYVKPIRDTNTNGIPALVYDSTSGEITYSSTGGQKTFIIDHPLDENKYLVHACLEGPEAGVYYRGTATIPINTKFVEINLPDYVEHFTTDYTVQITPIVNDDDDEDDDIPILASSRVKNGKFKVYVKICSSSFASHFDYIVFGKRSSIIVEPNKIDVKVKGDGPYTWI